MKVVTIFFLCFTILFASSSAALVKDTAKRQVCQMEIRETWSGICTKNKGDETCNYNPPVGWALKSYKPIIDYIINGDFKVTETTTTTNNLVPEDVATSVFIALLASGKLDGDSLVRVATLLGEYVALRKNVPENGTFALVARGHAEAHGQCWDRKTGKVIAHVEVEEVYVGEDYKDVVDWILLEYKALGPIVESLQCDDNGCRME
eukprot:TRINITY_DN3146_c0_g2_i3.p3 TRINITY_DN3146_c0_g2~~TRINITY_DN3146_c0_g2_i3.p3  ORF type:complete len:206 (-),score=32.82 TRINITY_DN3146_c0_g2_i3:796-1413(-)